MSLAGKQIGKYRIIELLGVGGMAVVYKAFDTKLERDVAFKVIRIDDIPPSQLEHFLLRFEREAKTQSKFNHPHIVQVYDYGKYESAPFLVMSYLPGGTLKDKIGDPMPYQQAAELLAPIADALAYAHKQNVLHRDVKPGNILFNKKGQPFLSDFGIAKLLKKTNEATLTDTGMGIGTPQYMAPEQWGGNPVKESDIYALGVVFYELVTGHKPYNADVPAGLVILQATEPPTPPTEYVPNLPLHVEQVLLTPLAKRPEDRFASMEAVSKVLKELSEETEVRQKEPEPAPEPPEDETPKDLETATQPRPKRKLPVWGCVFGILFTGVIVIGGLIYGVMQMKDSPLFANARPTATERTAKTDEGSAEKTPEPTNTIPPTATSTLQPEATETEAPTPTENMILLPTPFGGGQKIAFYSYRAGSPDIWVIDSDGSNPVQLTDFPIDEFSPEWSPDGTKILFFSNRRGSYDIYLMDADGSNLIQLTNSSADDENPYWSPDGSQIVFQSNRSGNWDIWRMNADGTNIVQLTTDNAPDYTPVWSPDGSKIAFHSNRSGNADIWLMDPDGGDLLQLTFSIATDYAPNWSSDGSQIVFLSKRGGNDNDIWVMNADGSNQTSLTDDSAFDDYPSWSPDGSKIIFSSYRSGNWDLWIMDADGSNLVQLTNDAVEDYAASWQPAP